MISLWRNLVWPAAAILATTGVSLAVPLAPGGSASVSGTNSTSDPTLSGTIIAQSTNPISAYSAFDDTVPFFTVQLQATVIRETATGTLDFYYQIQNNNIFLVDPVKTVSVASFAGFGTDADFRTDQGGAFAPTSISRSSAGDTVTFANLPNNNGIFFADGQETNALLVKTNATNYSADGLMAINFAGVDAPPDPVVPASATLSTFAPVSASAPEPASLCLLASVLAGCVIRRKTHRSSTPSFRIH